jgi:TadE-like protein
MKKNATHGSAMMEFVLVMPLLFVMIMGVLQIAHIWMARQVVHYAAYCAARSTLTANTKVMKDQFVARNAAYRVCSWIAFDDTADGSSQDVTEIPGWGKIPFSNSVKKRTRVYTGITDLEYAGALSTCPWQTRAVVEFDFALLMPVAGQMMSYLAKQDASSVAGQIRSGSIGVRPGVGWTGQEEKKNYPYPYITLKEMCILPKPYNTAIYPVSL